MTLNVSGGFSNSAVDFRPTLNGDQRRDLLYEGLVNYATDQGMESPTAYADGLIDNYASRPSIGYTDWRKELLRTATQQSYEASVSGGTERTSYYASLGYNKQEGLAKNSGLERYSARLNLKTKIGKYGEVGANMMFSQLNQELNEERTSAINPFFDVAVTMNPSMTVRDEEGNYIGAYPGSTLNPLRDILTDYNIQKDARYYNPLSSAGPKSGSDARTAKGFIEYGRLNSSTSIHSTATWDSTLTGKTISAMRDPTNPHSPTRT